MAAALLTKTGPISGAVWARGLDALELDDGFSSLEEVRNKMTPLCLLDTKLLNREMKSEKKRNKRISLVWVRKGRVRLQSNSSLAPEMQRCWTIKKQCGEKAQKGK